jgi:hypothetical protein
MRSAFTVIEIMVSVMLISIVILAIAKMEERSMDMAHYITVRADSELANSLFLGEELEARDMEKVDAYTLLSDTLRIKKEESRDILKSIERELRISDPIPIGEELPVNIELRAVMLKAEYPARYYRIEIKTGNGDAKEKRRGERLR